MKVCMPRDFSWRGWGSREEGVVVFIFSYSQTESLYLHLQSKLTTVALNLSLSKLVMDCPFLCDKQLNLLLQWQWMCLSMWSFLSLSDFFFPLIEAFSHVSLSSHLTPIFLPPSLPHSFRHRHQFVCFLQPTQLVSLTRTNKMLDCVCVCVVFVYACPPSPLEGYVSQLTLFWKANHKWYYYGYTVHLFSASLVETIMPCLQKQWDFID